MRQIWPLQTRSAGSDGNDGIGNTSRRHQLRYRFSQGRPGVPGRGVLLRQDHPVIAGSGRSPSPESKAPAATAPNSPGPCPGRRFGSWNSCGRTGRGTHRNAKWTPWTPTRPPRPGGRAPPHGTPGPGRGIAPRAAEGTVLGDAIRSPVMAQVWGHPCGRSRAVRAEYRGPTSAALMAALEKSRSAGSLSEPANATALVLKRHTGRYRRLHQELALIDARRDALLTIHTPPAPGPARGRDRGGQPVARHGGRCPNRADTTTTCGTCHSSSNGSSRITYRKTRKLCRRHREWQWPWTAGPRSPWA